MGSCTELWFPSNTQLVCNHGHALHLVNCFGWWQNLVSVVSMSASHS